MRISWVTSESVALVRQVMTAEHADWTVHFAPAFIVPPAPAGVEAALWAKLAEHIARAERVSQDIRSRGLEMAMIWYGESKHAIELATLTSAAVQSEALGFDLLARLLACAIDDLVVYGSFLALLDRFRADRPDQALAAYESFCHAFAAHDSDHPHWPDRVNAVRDGLATFYIQCEQPDKGHELFLQRHNDDTGDLLVALAASRSFLSSGEIERAATWLGIGADRASELGRDAMATRLRAKQARLRQRLP